MESFVSHPRSTSIQYKYWTYSHTNFFKESLVFSQLYLGGGMGMAGKIWRYLFPLYKIIYPVSDTRWDCKGHVLLLMPTHHLQVKSSRFLAQLQYLRRAFATAIKSAWDSAPCGFGHYVNFHRLAKGDGALDTGFHLGWYLTTLNPGGFWNAWIGVVGQQQPHFHLAWFWRKKR